MKTLHYLLITLDLALVLVSSIYSYHRVKAAISPVETKVDTLVIRDTITQIQPVPIISRVVDTQFVACLVDSVVRVHDTLYIPVPISQKVYEDSTYRAVVSGYRARLDEIEVYPTTKVITQTTTITQPSKPKPWGIGLQAGCGLSYNGASPYIGVGISYNVLRF